MEGGGYRATTPEENREEERQIPEPAAQRYSLRHHRGAQGRRAWPLRLLQPHDRGKIQGREGRAAGGGETSRTPKTTWHMFRHTFASRLTRDGVDIVTVKGLLGHANISTTMRYAHSNDDAKRRAVNRLRSDKIVTMPAFSNRRMILKQSSVSSRA